MLGSATPALRRDLTRSPERIRALANALSASATTHARTSKSWTCARVSRDQAAGDHLFAKIARGNIASPRTRRTGYAATESSRILELHGMPRVRGAPAVHELLGRRSRIIAATADALSLLRICRRKCPTRCPNMRQRPYSISRHRLRARGRRTPSTVAHGTHRASRS